MTQLSADRECRPASRSWSGRLAGAAPALAAGGQPAPPRRSSGTLHRAQAFRGKAVFAQSCAACHGAALTGGSAPPLTGRAFELSWSHPRVTLDDMFYLPRTTMPPRASSSVSPRITPPCSPTCSRRTAIARGRPRSSKGAAGLHAAASMGGDANRPATAEGQRARHRPPRRTFIEGEKGAVPASTGPDQAALSAAVEVERLAALHARLLGLAVLAARPDQRGQCLGGSRPPACSRSARRTTSRPVPSCTRGRCT